MLKVENFETYGWEAAVRGMRNPMNSWEKSDSGYIDCEVTLCEDCPLYVQNENPYCHLIPGGFFLGPNDMDLMQRLRKGGSDDRKYLRQIFVSCDITAPLYWWKEMDQYKVSTVTNSCSTMHKIASKEFVLDDFSHEHLNEETKKILETVIWSLNVSRDCFRSDSSKKDYWWQMIQLLPSSYNQKRTWTANYEVLVNIYRARHAHKLDEWHTFCDWIRSLPYSELITGETKNDL